MKRTYDLEERLLRYSVRIIKIVEQLPNTKAGKHIAGQLLRSGTSPYPNHGEAQAAESPNDFVHKLSVSLKELRETQRWLKLIQHVPLIKSPELMDNSLEETEELIRIFVASIKTARRNKTDEHRTSNVQHNIEHRIRKDEATGIKVECSVMRSVVIRRWTLDVRCSMFILSKQTCKI
jgi:four helix bundle protein